MHLERRPVRATARTCAIWLLPALCAAPVLGQETLWRTHMDSGDKAKAAARYAEAEKLYTLAVTEAERFGPTDARLASSLNNLAMLYHTQGKYVQAEPLYRRSLSIFEKTLDPEHPNVGSSLENYGALLKATGRADDGRPMLKRAATIRKNNAGR